MRVDEETIRHVARVARLNLTDEEVRRFLPQMKDIIKAVSVIDAVDTTDTLPSFQPIALPDRLRDDDPGTCLSQEEALRNAKGGSDGYFKGPKAV